MLELFDAIQDELNIVEQELKDILQAPDSFLTETTTHLFKAGGKRLRPAFSLLAAKCVDFDFERVLPLAVALELIHMATLVHDDVVDSSDKRRGVPTLKALYGNKISTHVGGYLFSRSLVIVSGYREPLISTVLAHTSLKMCEGEILQIATCHDLGQTIKDYFFRIKYKTALLISVSCQLGAAACGAPAGIYEALRLYGYNIGMAFQITDDILDMVADRSLLGKPVGSDLRQGILTLPVIYALARSSQRERLAGIISSREQDEEKIHEGIKLIEECGGIAFAHQVARKFIARAKSKLAVLPDTPAKKSLALVGDFIDSRGF